MHALRGAQGNDFTGKAESMKMGMNLWSFANKPLNRKDSKLPHRKVL